MQDKILKKAIKETAAKLSMLGVPELCLLHDKKVSKSSLTSWANATEDNWGADLSEFGITYTDLAFTIEHAEAIAKQINK